MTPLGRLGFAYWFRPVDGGCFGWKCFRGSQFGNACGRGWSRWWKGVGRCGSSGCQGGAELGVVDHAGVGAGEQGPLVGQGGEGGGFVLGVIDIGEGEANGIGRGVRFATGTGGRRRGSRFASQLEPLANSVRMGRSRAFQ